MNQKTKNILFLVVGIVAIVVISNFLQNKSSESFRSTLDEKEQEVANTHSEKIDSQEIQQSGPQKLIVKGFDIGMTPEQAYNKLLELYPSATKIRFDNWIIKDFSPTKKEFIELIELNPQDEKMKVVEYIPLKKLTWFGTTHERDNNSSEPNAYKWVLKSSPSIFDFEKEDYTLLSEDENIQVKIKNGVIRNIFIFCSAFNACTLSFETFAQSIIDNYHIPEFEINEDGDYQYDSDEGYRVIVRQGNKLLIGKIAAKKETKFD